MHNHTYWSNEFEVNPSSFQFQIEAVQADARAEPLAEIERLKGVVKRLQKVCERMQTEEMKHWMG